MREASGRLGRARFLRLGYFQATTPVSGPIRGLMNIIAAIRGTKDAI